MGLDDNDYNDNHVESHDGDDTKGIGDAGSTADLRMLWSAIDASHLTSTFAPFRRSGR